MENQFGSDVEYNSLDRGTPAWAIKSGPAAIAPIPEGNPTATVQENFDSLPLWSQITFGGDSGTGAWATATDSFHSSPKSFKSPALSTGQFATFTMFNDTFDQDLIFWARVDGANPIGPSINGLVVKVDGVTKLTVSDFDTGWIRYTIALNFGYQVDITYQQDFSAFVNRAWVDDIVFGTRGTPAVPGSPAHPKVYAPLVLCDEDDRLLVSPALQVILAVPEAITGTENFETDPISGSGTWAVTTSSPHAGARCLQSATITNSQTTDYTMSVPGGATAIRFWNRVSSENNFDWFRIYKDVVDSGNLLYQLSGTANTWAQQTLLLMGATSVIFRYSKDSSDSAGLDAAFIDDIEWIIPAIAPLEICAPLHTNSDGDLVIRPLDCITDSITICSGVDPIDVTGTVVISNFPVVAHLDCATDSITICSGVDPINVIITNFPATVALDAATLAALETITVLQGTSPWVVSGTVNIGTIPEVEIKNDSGNPIPVTGTVALDASTLAALETITVLQGTSPWVVSGTVNIGTIPEVEIKNDTGNPIPVTGPLTDTQLRATPVPVSGTVTATGPLTDIQLRATPVPVSGTVAATQSGTWTTARSWDLNFAVDQIDASGSVVALDAPTLAALETITVLQGTSPWVVSGTVNIGTIPEIEIKNDAGNPIPVSGTVALDATTLAALETITVLQGTSPWVVSGTVNIGTIPEVEIKNDSGNPIPVTGTVTITDGSGPVTVDGTVALASGTITSLTAVSGTLNNGVQVTVTGSATSLVAANANRRKLIIQNVGLDPARVGTTGVTATTGMNLPAGGTIIFDMPNCPTNDIFAIRDGLVNTTILVQEIVA